jgi:hypothetical protein
MEGRRGGPGPCFPRGRPGPGLSARGKAAQGLPLRRTDALMTRIRAQDPGPRAIQGRYFGIHGTGSSLVVASAAPRAHLHPARWPRAEAVLGADLRLHAHSSACALWVRLAGPRPLWHRRVSGARSRACGVRAGRDRCAACAQCAAAPPLTAVTPAASARTMRGRKCESFDLHRGSVKSAGGGRTLLQHQRSAWRRPLAPASEASLDSPSSRSPRGVCCASLPAVCAALAARHRLHILR